MQPESGGAGDNRGMPELPTGTITMLFSDIEGSTRLLGRLGERYPAVLSVQRKILRQAIGACRGYEMGTEGDSFFVVFGSAADAVRCCVTAQRNLAGEDWPAGIAVQVRMGLHSGEPIRHEDGYVGMDVHRAARIAATAHGGQVVLSEVTRSLAGIALTGDVSVKDLGWHRLKDIEEPERIYQLVADGLAGQFPALRSLGAQTSLPEPPSPLIGRDDELARLAGMAVQPGIRLITLTGAGGVGKTRLALAVAAALGPVFEHGVYFVPLAAVRDGEVLWKSIADLLDVTGPGPAEAVVTGHLRGRHALLVLDNLEQLDQASGAVGSLLAGAPGVVVLATSRSPLHLTGEHQYPVRPLSVPGGQDLAEVAATGAARLFAQQAAMVRPGFALTGGNCADIAAICRRLDGLPLAIELAAARVRLLSPGALLARLATSLSLTTPDTGRPARHQALRSTIAWSYELLSADRQEQLMRTSAFTGGCDLEAFSAVALADPGADPLPAVSDLLDASLITVSDDDRGEPRVGMLETIREFARERLSQDGSSGRIRRRHASYYAGLAEQLSGELRGPGRLAVLRRFEIEIGNMHAALDWAFGAEAGEADRTGAGLRLVQALAPFWYEHGHAGEGRRWLRRALELADGGPQAGQLTHWLGVLLQQQGQNELAIQFLERSLAIWREHGQADLLGRELNSLGIAHSHLDHPAVARSLVRQSIAVARENGGGGRLAAALTSLGHVESLAGNFDLASAALTEALDIDTAAGDELGAAIDRQSLALVWLRAGQTATARDLAAASFGYVLEAGDTEFLANTLELAAAILAQSGDGQAAARCAGAAGKIRLQAGIPQPPPDAAMLERFLGPARAEMPRDCWDLAYAAGHALSQQQAADLLREAPAFPAG